jgi:hypothetical protein
MRLPRTFTGEGGKRWRIHWRRPDKADAAHALCYPQDHVIQVDPSLDDELMLAALVDEVCHAHFPALDNEAVDAFSDAVASLLARAGYQRESD